MARNDASWVAIACGGTGGHLFPGLAVGEVLAVRGWSVTLLISTKEIDRRAAEVAPQFEYLPLPAVGLERGRWLAFGVGLARSYRAARCLFRRRRPAAVLAMGGFIAAPPVLAGRRAGARTFLHESNSIPGRANRWLARWVDRAFVGFPQAAARLRHCSIEVTGTPVRSGFGRASTAACRRALGLDPGAPVLLVMGGSQGASGINRLVREAWAELSGRLPTLQLVHLTGTLDFPRLEEAYRPWPGRVIVRAFMKEMETVLGAATVAVSRAGASSLAEFAAAALPAILVPYPTASDNHQWCNARALVDTGAARMLEQPLATPVSVAALVEELVQDESARGRMRDALRRWHRPDAAQEIAAHILRAVLQSDTPPTRATFAGPSTEVVAEATVAGHGGGGNHA
jgi:UDP-N-acetylglucosamine--N-acetylmuramyl-(pentapeptide) pyrophosphoryl-undecaprenol N-acetylglucosamine transferase